MRVQSGAGLRRPSEGLVALLLAGTCVAGAAQAQVLWDGTSNALWNNPDNWTPAAVPTPGETALFNGATPKTITVTGASVDIATIQFDPHAAPGYTFNISTGFTLSGAGIVNNSGNIPTFNVSLALMQLDGIATAGNAIINNTTGAVTFTGSTTGGTATITTSNFGTTSFTDTSTAGTATLIVDNNGLTQLSSNARGGTATMIVNNGGLLRFFGLATAENATIAVNNGGTVTLQDTATLGASTVTINNGGTVGLAGTSTGGDARLIINAGGTFDFTGLFGAATPSAGSIEGAGTICLCNHAFTVGSNNMSTVFSGTIQNGPGGGTPSQLVKVGTGTLTLAAGGTYGHTGPTTVNGGILQVDGSIATSSLLTVNNGGTVGGTGQLPSTIINNGGMVAPGASIGTVTVNGNLTLAGGSSYLLEVSPTAADRINVTGTATLGGTVTAVFQAGTYVSRNYTILSATGGIIGTFSSLSSSLPGFVGSLSYTSNDVVLTLTAQLGSATGLTINQRNVATAVNTFFNGGGALPPAFLGLFGLSGASLGNVLDQLSGEVATGSAVASFESMRRFTSAMLDPWAGTRADNGLRGPALGFAAEPVASEALAFAPMPTKATAFEKDWGRKWTTWVAAYGSHGRLPGEGVVVGSHDVTIRTGGLASGIDYRVSPSTVVGIAFAGGTETFANALGSGKGDVLQAGLYGSTRFNDYYVSAAALLARFDLATERTATMPGVSESLLADFTAYGFGARLEAGRRFLIHNFGLTPYAAVQVQSVRHGGYAERGAVPGSVLALTYSGRTATSTRSELGGTFDARFGMLSGGPVSLFWRAAWGHEFNRDNAINAAFQSLPGTLFTVYGAAPWANAALISSGFDWRITERVSLRGKLESELASGAATVAGTGTLRVSW